MYFINWAIDPCPLYIALYIACPHSVYKRVYDSEEDSFSVLRTYYREAPIARRLVGAV